MQTHRAFPRLRAALCLAALALSANACSWMFVHAPPIGHERMDYFTCTEENGWPLADAAMAGLSVAGALMIATNNAYDDAYLPYSRDAYLAVGLAEGVAFAISAGSGFHKVKACREARRLWAARQAARAQQVPASTGTADTAVSAVVVKPGTDTLEVGETVQFVATAHASSGALVAGRTFAWTTSDAAVASVGAAGLVTARTVGTAVVSAASGAVSGTATVVVRARR